MTALIRLATPDDAPGVQAIYAPIVRETAISFELEPPTVEAMRQRILVVPCRYRLTLHNGIYAMVSCIDAGS
jgi:L-amino acid N-acyltransferase YncA